MDQQARLQRAADVEEIRQCLMSYCRGVDRGDADAMWQAYHPGATEEHGTFKGTVEEYIPYALDQLSNVDLCKHMLMNVLVEMAGDDVAFCESYVLGFQRERGSSLESYYSGRYLDRFERRNEHWKIAARVTVFDWSAAGEHNPSSYEGLAGFPTGTHDKTDPMYAVRRAILAAPATS